MKKLAKWTGKVIGTLHVYGISHKEFAEYVGMNQHYLSSVLHGHTISPKAERKILTALEEITAPKRSKNHG